MATDQLALPHRIRQVVFDIQYLDEPTALHGRRQLEEAFHQVLAPLLAEVFDAYAPNGRLIQIDRLEIDLGRIDPERLDRALIRQAIGAELDTRLGALTAAAPNETPVVMLEAALLHFLESGHWPWHATLRRIHEVESAVLDLAPAEARRLTERLHLLLQRPPVRLRVANQFGPAFLDWLVEQMQPRASAEIQQVAQTVLGDLPVSELWATLLAVVARIPVGETVSVADLEQRLRIERGRRTEEPLATTGVAPEKELTSPLRKPEREPIQGIETPSSEPTGLSERRQSRQLTDPPPEGVYVPYAGVVLLYPFLDQYFRRLGLLLDDVPLATIEQRERAVHLLYHLVTGQEQPEEHETPLFKLLCGLPIAFPLIKALSLRQQERDETEMLLAAVIEHWDKLKNTSLAALRETFLQREGKLVQGGDKVRLVVEQRTVDVLLDYLPWTLSIVRLPWLTLPLWVDWA
jgi:hypothetical protein